MSKGHIGGNVIFFNSNWYGSFGRKNSRMLEGVELPQIVVALILLLLNVGYPRFWFIFLLIATFGCS